MKFSSKILELLEIFSISLKHRSRIPRGSHKSLKKVIQPGNDGLNRECTVSVNYEINHMLRMVRFMLYSQTNSRQKNLE